MKLAMVNVTAKKNLLHAPFFAGVISGERPANSSVYAPWIAVYNIIFSRNAIQVGVWRVSSVFKFPGFKALDG
jgi:hypothetical protein